ncbi:TolC family protein [Lacrimispora sp.]|uniref:TolC family protein n=1 Tax=Lacrimispora sp. TaxID=2719234 RepID=UPI0028AB3E17|nr:TolC family protein [Lacrimispora sp.]
MREKRCHFHLALTMAVVAVLAVPATFSAYGAGPGQTEETIPDGVTEEQWTRLNDQTVEFNELSNLVRYFNPAVQNITQSISNSISNFQYILDETRGYIRDLEDDAEELEDSGATDSPEGLAQYNMLNMTVKSLKTSTDSMGRSLNYMNRTNSNVTQAVKTYTYYANQLMINYSSVQSGFSSLQKLVETDTVALESAKISYGLGKVTQSEVLSAQKKLFAAQSSLLSMENTVDNLRRSLCLMTGYSSDSEPNIGTIPQLDMEELSAMDLEADTEKAVRNNYSLISDRHTVSNRTTTGVKSKKDSISESEQTIAVTMQSNYQIVQQAKTAYESAYTAYEMAKLEWGKAERSYQHGLISQNQYLQSQVGFLQAESGLKSTYNDLYLAYVTYRWAVDGIIMTSH